MVGCLQQSTQIQIWSLVDNPKAPCFVFAKGTQLCRRCDTLSNQSMPGVLCINTRRARGRRTAGWARNLLRRASTKALHILHACNANSGFVQWMSVPGKEMDKLVINVNEDAKISIDTLCALLRAFPVRMRGPLLAKKTLIFEFLHEHQADAAAITVASQVSKKRKLQTLTSDDETTESALYAKTLNECLHEYNSSSVCIAAHRSGLDDRGRWHVFDVRSRAFQLDVGRCVLHAQKTRGASRTLPWFLGRVRTSLSGFRFSRLSGALCTSGSSCPSTRRPARSCTFATAQAGSKHEWALVLAGVYYKTRLHQTPRDV